jgi:hypothetical protein
VNQILLKFRSVTRGSGEAFEAAKAVELRLSTRSSDDGLGNGCAQLSHPLGRPLRDAAAVTRQVCDAAAFHALVIPNTEKRLNRILFNPTDGANCCSGDLLKAWTRQAYFSTQSGEKSGLVEAVSGTAS